MTSTFCKGCGAKMEWHPHRDGRTVAIDPDPVEGGPLAFGPGMKLGPATAASKRRFRYHITACSKPQNAMSKSGQPACDYDGCKRTDWHLHCFRCGSTDHLANNCEEES